MMKSITFAETVFSLVLFAKVRQNAWNAIHPQENTY